MNSLILKTPSASRGTTSGVRRPVSKDTPDRTDAHRRTCPASEDVRNGRTGQTGRHADKDYWDSSIGYTLADLQEMDRLIRELAELEDWPEERLADALDQRRRMAPVRVPGALEALRRAHREALAGWPEKPSTSTEIELVDVGATV